MIFQLDPTIVGCYFCGTELHDYEARVACLLTYDMVARDEFVCDVCYQRWQDGKVDG